MLAHTEIMSSGNSTGLGARALGLILWPCCVVFIELYQWLACVFLHIKGEV